MTKILSKALLYLVWIIDAMLYIPVKIFKTLHEVSKQPQMIIDKPTPIVNPAWLRWCVDTHPVEVADIEIAKAKKQARWLAGDRRKTEGEKIRDIYKDKFLK